MNLTEKSAHMVADAKFESLSEGIIDKTKLLILDHIGCMVGGSVMPEAQRLRVYLESIDGGGQASVVGGKPMSAPNAAHANAQSANILSLDDSFIRYGHPGMTILPSALAVAETIDAGGSEFIAAVVAGYEMSMRLGMSLRATPKRDQQVKGYASWQIFGATTAAAKLHGLSADQIAAAFGMTAWHAPQPFLRKFHSRPMNWLKNNYGWACKGGVTSVDLTIAGYEGNRSIFDGPDGYWAMAGSDQFDPEMLVLPYANRSFVAEIGFKPYAGCRWSHTAIDAIRILIREHGVSTSNLRRLEIETVSEFVRDLNGEYPQSTIEAVFHTPYLVALELLGKSSAYGLHESDLSDVEVKMEVRKILMSGLPEADEKFFNDSRTPVRMTAYLDDGGKHIVCTEIPTGHPEGPKFGRKEVIDKFLSLSEPVIGADPARRLCENVLNIERHKIRNVMRF